MTKPTWTPEEDARLEALWNLGEKTTVIPKILEREFGRTFNKNMVVGRKHRLHLDNRPSPIKHFLSDSQKSAALALLTNGSTIKNVVARTGISDSSADKIRARAHVVEERPTFTPEPTPSPAPKPVFKRPTPLPKPVTTFKYIPHAKCLSPDGCSETIAPHSPYAYCAKHRRKYYAYDPMTDRGRDVKVWTPWANSTKPEKAEDLEKAE